MYVGCSVVGLLVGFLDGSLVGSGVSEVGVSVGIYVGCSVVGLLVGFLEGSLVGAGVTEGFGGFVGLGGFEPLQTSRHLLKPPCLASSLVHLNPSQQVETP